MKKTNKKQIIIYFIVIIILLGIGFAWGFGTKLLIDQEQLIKDKEKLTSLSKVYSKSEIEKLKATVEKDEADYGNNYQDFKSFNPYVYNKDPDRIYFKSSKIGAFYVFEKDDENYAHLLEVAEDRMSYSAMDDYNLNCFAPDSINTMMTSGENYIIFDFDNSSMEGNRDIILKFNENTRLYRLVTYLSYYKDPILRKDLSKEEFANDTDMNGYQYMTYVMGG